MKTQIRLFVALCCAALLPGLTVQAEQNQFYVAADFGAALTSDVKLTEFYGPVVSGSKIELDPGFRLGLRGGYGLTDWFDAEVETGFTANNISSITASTESDGTLANFPLLLNARFHFPITEKISTYFGGGLGISTVVLSGDDIVIGGTSMDGSASGVAFAYQAFVGVRYAINKRMGVSLEYHYFATASSSLEADSTSGTASDHLDLDGTESHGISAAFEFKF